MESSDSDGDTTPQQRENGDARVPNLTRSERPLKKARFAWQIKGNRKHHFKNETSEAKSVSTTTSEPDRPSSSRNESNNNDLVGSTEQNLEILGDYLLKQDFNTLDSVIADSDKSLLKPSAGLSTERSDYPRYVSSSERRLNASSSYSSQHIYTTPPVQRSVITPRPLNEDQCIARWQARQMAKGFVDNTINRVLDSWINQRLPADLNTNRFLGFDVAEFINNLPGDNSIENEGILMAISAHGLQNTSSSRVSYVEDSSDSNRELYSPRTITPIQSRRHLSTSKHKLSKNDELDHAPWEGNERHPSKKLFPDQNEGSMSSDSDDGVIETPRINMRQVTEQYNNPEYEFMDAAVSFAIQNKGLTFGVDYG